MDLDTWIISQTLCAIRIQWMLTLYVMK